MEKRDRRRIDVKADTLLSLDPLLLSIKQNACTERPSSSCYLASSVRATAQDGLFSFLSFGGSSKCVFYHFDPRTRNENTRTYSGSSIAVFIRKQEISTMRKDRMITDTVYIKRILS